LKLASFQNNDEKSFIILAEDSKTKKNIKENLAYHFYNATFNASANSMLILGSKFENGEDVIQSYNVAEFWYRNAILRGHPNALLSISKMIQGKKINEMEFLPYLKLSETWGLTSPQEKTIENKEIIKEKPKETPKEKPEKKK